MTAPARGYLLVRVEEASGKTQRGDLFTWDTTSGSFEAFVKVELRGGERNIKASTTKAPLINDTITWRESLKLDVLDGSNELRIMLCREKYTGVPAKKGTAVIAACGIFVNDIIDAVPIDKYFELFKPNAGGEGGQIRICLNFSKDLATLDPASTPNRLVDLSENAAVKSTAAPAPAAAVAAAAAAPAPAPSSAATAGSADKASTESKPRSRRGRRLLIAIPIISTAVVGAVVGTVVGLMKRK